MATFRIYYSNYTNVVAATNVYTLVCDYVGFKPSHMFIQHYLTFMHIYHIYLISVYVCK